MIMKAGNRAPRAKITTQTFQSDAFNDLKPHVYLPLVFEFLHWSTAQPMDAFLRDKYVRVFKKHIREKIVMEKIIESARAMQDTIPHSYFNSFLFGRAIATFSDLFDLRQLNFTPINTKDASKNVVLTQAAIEHQNSAILLTPKNEELGLCFGVNHLKTERLYQTHIFNPQSGFHTIYGEDEEAVKQKTNILIRQLLDRYKTKFPFASFHHFDLSTTCAPEKQERIIQHELDFDLVLKAF